MRPFFPILLIILFGQCTSPQKNGSAENTPPESSEVQTNPCDIPFVPDPIIRNYWIGMPREEGLSEFVQFGFNADSLNRGLIKVIPVWQRDTVVEVKFEFHPSKGSALELLKGSLKHILKERKHGCEEISYDPLPEKIHCGRTTLTIFPGDATILITDACMDYLKQNKLLNR